MLAGYGKQNRSAALMENAVDLISSGAYGRYVSVMRVVHSIYTNFSAADGLHPLSQPPVEPMGVIEDVRAMTRQATTDVRENLIILGSFTESSRSVLLRERLVACLKRGGADDETVDTILMTLPSCAAKSAKKTLLGSKALSKRGMAPVLKRQVERAEMSESTAVSVIQRLADLAIAIPKRVSAESIPIMSYATLAKARATASGVATKY